MSRKQLVIWLVAGLGLTTALLRSFGQPWWCACGSPNPWSSQIFSRHNSQHLLDPYSFTHYEHGLLLFLAFWFLLGDRWSSQARFLAAVWAECLWEVFENTPWTLQRYRQNTIALDYYGDSVANALGDILCCALGYAAAASVSIWVTLASLVVLEVTLVLAVRDSLLLNVVQLVAPQEALRRWQQRSP